MRLCLTTLFLIFVAPLFASQVTLEVRNAYDGSTFTDAKILICNFFDNVKEVIDIDRKGQAKVDFKRSVYLKIKSEDNRYFGGTYRYKKKEVKSLEIVYVFPEPGYEKRILDSLGCEEVRESTRTNTLDENNKDSIILATFPGGAEAMFKYFSESIVYPEESMINGDEGKVYIDFIVEVDGSIDCVFLLRNVSKRIGAEALRVIRLMPKWEPARVNGDSVRARVRIPINFKLN